MTIRRLSVPGERNRGWTGNVERNVLRGGTTKAERVTGRGIVLEGCYAGWRDSINKKKGWGGGWSALKVLFWKKEQRASDPLLPEDI